jgi:hypothetical protein
MLPVLTPKKAKAIASLPIPAKLRFLLGRRLAHFGYAKSARDIIHTTPLSKYPERLHSQVVLLASAIEPDQACEALMLAAFDKICLEPKQRKWRILLTWFSRHSGLPYEDRVAAIDRLSALVFPGGEPSIARDVAIALAQIQVRQSAGILVDIEKYIPPLPTDPPDARRFLVFVPMYRSHGYPEKGLEILANFQVDKNETYVLHMLRYFPVHLDVSEIQIPKTGKKQVTLASALKPHVGLSQAHAEIFRKLISSTQQSFQTERMKNRHSILVGLANAGLHDEALECLNMCSDPRNETLLSVRSLRAWQKYHAFKFADAAADFEDILREAPKVNDAQVGFRFALARCGHSMQDVYETLREICGEPTVDAEPNVWRHFEQGNFTQLGRDFQKGKRWGLMYQYLGDKMINTWPEEKMPDKSFLFVADQGVGDEIRQYRYYNEMVGTFGKMHATCDPRLQGLLEHNFPKITFHPVWRSRIGLSDRLHKMQGRIQGFNGGMYNTLTQDIRSLLDSVDYVGNYMSLGIAGAEGKLKYVANGAAIRSPNPEPSRKSGQPLRVGLLWRSSLVSGARRLMYLSETSLAPILDVEDVEFHSVQHNMSDQELAFCHANKIVVRQDIDFYDDFDAMAAYLASLDLVVGISTVPAELAAALGVPVWFLGFSPENLNLRTLGGRTETDQLTSNALVIGPKNRDFNRPPPDCIVDTVDAVRERLDSLVQADSDQKQT